jgi:hypothetical protein
MERPSIDTINDLTKKVTERVARFTERGLEEIDKGASGVAKAAQAEIACALGLVEKSTEAVKGFLNGEGREEAERLVTAAAQTARESAARWLGVAADAVARARDLTDVALGGNDATPPPQA